MRIAKLYNKKIFFNTRELTCPNNSFSTYNASNHLNPCLWKHLFKQASKMMILQFVNSHNQDGIFWIEQFLCNLQTSLNHRQPLRVTIRVRTVHIVTVILPIVRIRFVVRRINIDTIHHTRI